MLRQILHRIVRLLFAMLSRLQVVGIENIPAQGGMILAANHLGILDSPLIFCLLERRDATSLVADTYRHNFFVRWLVESVGGIWVNRQQADFQALRAARDYLQQGGILGIAPEGTRSRTGALRPAKTGVAYLAEKARVPILPIAITGTEDAFSRLLHLQRPRITVRFGDPFILPPLDPHDRSASLQRNTEEIMHRIAVMLPEKYRGAYADLPLDTLAASGIIAPTSHL
jgi:1-acyl-sn-glycerol-3-phosphate acyltransferase